MRKHLIEALCTFKDNTVMPKIIPTMASKGSTVYLERKQHCHMFGHFWGPKNARQAPNNSSLWLLPFERALKVTLEHHLWQCTHIRTWCVSYSLPASFDSKILIKLPTICIPFWVRMLSGWNCTPWICLWIRWRTPITSPSSVLAVTSSWSVGKVSSSITKLW